MGNINNMADFKTMISDAFSYDPTLALIFAVSVALIIILTIEYKTMRNNQTSRMVNSRIGKTGKNKSIDLFGKLIKLLSTQEEKVSLKLRQANVLFTTKEYMTFKTVGLLVGAILGLLLSPFSVIFATMLPGLSAIGAETFARVVTAIAFGFLGTLTPKIWLMLLISKRRKLMDGQLSDALMNIADALKSGHVIQDAIKIVGQEMAYPIGPEFAKTHREMETGKTLEAALEDLKIRVNLADFTMAINAMLIQYEVGGKLEPLLRNMVKIITERAELKKEIEKTIANSKTVGYVLLISPWFFVVVFSMLNKDTYLEMLRNPIGIIMLFMAFVSYCIAAWLIIFIIRDVSKEV